MQYTHLTHPHRRYNPLKDEWILVSPHRAQRPWNGMTEQKESEHIPTYDAGCYLCPRNKRIQGDINPDYTGTHVFPNDFSAIYEHDTIPADTDSVSSLLHSQPVQGTCRVVCFSPRHDLTLSQLSVPQIMSVVDTWIDQMNDLKKYKWVQIFENKGAIMGCSNPHPHSQIWAGDFIPNEIAKEDKQQRIYFEKHNKPLLIDYVEKEQQEEERIVLQNEDWIVLVPYWAVWPYETMLLPKKQMAQLIGISPTQKQSLAEIMKQLLSLYDELFHTSMPYSMGWHFAPSGEENNHWQFHAHYYPPLLRSATVKKFMVGYEMLGEAQRDLTAEQAAHQLRELAKSN